MGPKHSSFLLGENSSKDGFQSIVPVFITLNVVKSWEKFREFDSFPYISPYLDLGHLADGSRELEKRTIGLLRFFHLPYGKSINYETWLLQERV